MSSTMDPGRFAEAFAGCGLTATLEVGSHGLDFKLLVDISGCFRGAREPLVVAFLADTTSPSSHDDSTNLSRRFARELRLAERSLAILLHDSQEAPRISEECAWTTYPASKLLHELRGHQGLDFFKRLVLELFGLSNLNPFQSVRATNPNMFFGRKAELNSLIDLSDDFDNLVVVGPRRGGKTSLALEAHRRLRTDPGTRLSLGAIGGADRYLFSVSYVDTQTLVDFRDLWEAILRNMGLEQRDSVGGVRKKFNLRLGHQLVDKPDFELLADLLELKYQRGLILLDEADRLLEWDSENQWELTSRLRTLVDNVQARTKIVLLGYDKLYKFSKSAAFPLHGRFETLRIANLERDAARELIRVPMDELGITLEDDEQIVGRINRATGGLPHLIQDVCRAVVGHLSVINERRLTPNVVTRLLESEGRRLIERVFNAFTELPNPLARLIAYLAADAGELVTFQSLFGVLRVEHGLRLDDVQVRDALDYLFLHNVLHYSSPKGEYWFASELLRDRLRSDLIGPARKHLILALVDRVREQNGRSNGRTRD